MFRTKAFEQAFKGLLIILIGSNYMKKTSPLWLITVLLITSCGKELESNSVLANQNLSVNTLAGSGSQGSANGTGTAASFYQPTGITVDTAGNVYVADYRNNLIRKINSAGLVTTFVGTLSPGSANGTGTYASFFQPTGVAVDVSGNVYIADNGNNLIREISPAGVVTTMAGNGTVGFVNGIGSAASFSGPQGIAVDVSGNVYVADYGNNLIREISPNGVVTTLAGSGTSGSVNGVDTAAAFNEPTGVAVDVAGNVYVADYGNNLIRKISPAGMVTTLAGSGNTGAANGTGTAASFNGPTGLAVDASGNVYVADYGNNLVREITPAGVVTKLGSGTGGPGKSLSFNGPYGIAIDAVGNIYVAVYGNSTIQKINK
jgi:serine/threonine-protein kinase